MPAGCPPWPDRSRLVLEADAINFLLISSGNAGFRYST
jgi:hypothetical protein